VSELEQEQPDEGTGAPETEEEPETTDNPDEELEESEEASDEPEEGESEEAPEQAEDRARAARDQKELDKQRAQLDREDERHFKRLNEILGADTANLLQCPMCSHFFAGYLPPPTALAIPPEKVQIMRAFLGMPDLSNIQDDPDIHRCDRCNGKGAVRTGSDVPGYETIQCDACKGKGWVGSPLTAGNGISAASGVAPVEVTAPAVAGDSDDPAVRDLQRRGFLVVPPQRIGAE